MDSTEDIDSVDLTEDEDSRGTVIDSEVDNFAPNSSNCSELSSDNYFLHRISTCSPPPLTPIPRFTPLGTLATDKLPSVPKLTKIRRQNSISQRSPQKAVTLISSTVVKPAANGSSVSVDSEDEDVSIIQDDIENLVNEKPTFAMPSITVNPSGPSKQPGKLVVIKKNNKLYRIVIPHNVMPTTNQVGGPVMINIPEVGPLVIRIDPQAKNHILQKATQLEPFSLNFDEIANKTSSDYGNHQKIFGDYQNPLVKRRPRDFNKSVRSKDTLLSDPCFCWSYTKIKQRDKEFFLINDRLGFSKADIRKSRKCRKILEIIINKKTLEMKRIMDSFEELKMKIDKKHVIKPVEISKIVGESVIKCMEPSERYNIQNVRLPPNTVITHLNEFDDLLMTRKIVILNEDHTEKPESRIIHSSQSIARAKRNFRYTQKLKEKKLLLAKVLNDAQSRQDFTNLIKPCYVKMLRENYIDQMYNNSKATSTCTKPSLTSPKRKKIQPKLLPHVITEVSDMFMLKLIDTENKLKAEMAYIKPVLVINEFNFSIVKYAVEFSKSNIVFAVDENRIFPTVFLQNKDFIKAVKIGYVKLVDSEILCRYLVGNLGPQSPKKVDM